MRRRIFVVYFGLLHVALILLITGALYFWPFVSLWYQWAGSAPGSDEVMEVDVDGEAGQVIPLVWRFVQLPPSKPSLSVGVVVGPDRQPQPEVNLYLVEPTGGQTKRLKIRFINLPWAMEYERQQVARAP